MVEVISIEDAGYYSDAYTSGSTVRVTLARDGEFVTCDGILIWEEEYVGDELFEEWKGCALAGEEGYIYEGAI